MPVIPGLDVPAVALIAGASRGIGLALCETLLARDDVAQVWAVARNPQASTGLQQLRQTAPTRLRCVACDMRDEAALGSLADQLKKESVQLHLTICTVGSLHEDGALPEKALSQVTAERLQASFATNAIAPALLLKHLALFLRQRPATFAALSARVGSISDNGLGGWYGYRASKAALNQLLKTASIELKRLNPHSTVLSLHPGTTDTDLSKPFQANVPASKLFDPAFTASCMLSVIEAHGPGDTGTFWDWNNQPVTW